MKSEQSKLVNNAFTFLEKAIDQFKSEPRFSVINFCVAIELLLKARLIHEHWSLIIATNNTTHPNIVAFKAGNFRSINFSDLMHRIESVTGENIPNDAKDVFNKISYHRNKILHFYHEAHSISADEKLIEEIAKEQCSAWFYLSRLLEKWSEVFIDYSERIDEINGRMKEYKIYLATVYERVKEDIEKSKKRGISYRVCRSCEYDASFERQITEFLLFTKCGVCMFEETLLKLPCDEEDCKGEVILNYDLDDTSCPECTYEFTDDRIGEMIDTGSDMDEDALTKNCGLCDSPESVVEHEDHYVCTKCFAIATKIEVCEWCGEGQIFADLEFSGYEGCGFCEGRKGWDDD